MKNAVHRSSKSKHAVPAILAVGSSLAAMPAAALELGEVTVHSRLGQPLRASIAYALAPNESLANTCVSIGPAGMGLPGIGPATVSVSNGVINLTGATALREPMVSVRLVVDCPYSPNLSREYMMFVDPPTYDAPRAAEASAATSRAAVPSTSVVPTPAPQAAPRPVPVADIAQGSTIRVPAGSSLGEIAQRIENRTTSLWPTVNALFEANPHAFIDNDPNKLIAGATLTIPASLVTAVSEATSTAVPFEPAPVETPVETFAETVVETPADGDAYSGADGYVAPEPAVEEAVVEEAIVDEVAEQAPVEMTGDVAISDNPFVEPQPVETVTIPDTQLEGPATTSTSPNASTQIIVPKAEASGIPTWAWWLGGGVLAAIAGFLMFGRRTRQEPEPFMPSATDTPQRRFTDTVTTEALVVEEMEFNAEADYDIDDDSPTEENLVLDADLITGSGLEGGTDVDVNQDFGYAASEELDVELPFEPEASDTTGETDILPPPKVEESSILKSEVMPGEDEYDMSVIIDATKMPQPEEVTQHDLKAVEVRPDDETMISEGYTINREVDYEILEQDYEDELTATQALNEEIARAAAELAENMEENEDADESGETAVLPMASVTELDVTAEMPAANSDEVVELDATAEMPAEVDEDDDATAEMQIESGKSG